MRSHEKNLRVDFRRFNNTTKVPTAYRRIILTNICLARNEIRRLKKELAELPCGLPTGSCITQYTQTYMPRNTYEDILRKYKYRNLSHKKPIFPKINDEEGFSTKIHVGRDINPHYREALTLIETTRIREIKTETLNEITEHLSQLKNFYFYLSQGTGWSKRYKKSNQNQSENQNEEQQAKIEKVFQKIGKEFSEETLLEKLTRLYAERGVKEIPSGSSN